MSKAYRVEPSLVDACKVCYGGLRWRVVDTNGVIADLTFERKEDARQLCDMLSDAYERGVKEAPRPVEVAPAKVNGGPSFVGEKEVARILGVSVFTIQAWRVNKKGPPVVRFGSSVRYDMAEVLAWTKRT